MLKTPSVLAWVSLSNRLDFRPNANCDAKNIVTGRRILFVCPTCSPIGGLQTWLDQLSTGLESRGWAPIVALVHGPSTNDSAGYKAAHPCLHTVIIDGSALTMGARVREVMRTIRSLQPDFFVPLTVIDSHDSICELKRAGHTRTRYVLSIHGNLPQQIADVRLFQPFADVSVNPGALTCRLIERAGMPTERVFHAPNGVDLHPPRRPSHPELPIQLAYVGRLTNEDKRVMDLVGVVNALEASGIRYHLNIIGSGPCEERLRSAISSPAVTFHGFVESERLHRDFYPQCDILLMFSQSEAFGISLVEAMSHGVVPVSSRFVGSRSEGFLIDGQTARLFNIGDTAECARIVSQLALHRTTLAQISQQAHEHITRTYSWKRSVDDWEAALLTSAELPPRLVPAKAPRPLDEGRSLASRFPSLPPGVSDLFYKTKRRLFGIPEAMKHGEEWPMHTGCFTAAELAEIEALTVEMDQPCAE